MHATLDAFAVTAATNLFSLAWVPKNDTLALLIGFGVVALLLIVVTRGRLGYQPASSLPDATPAFNDSRS